MSITHHVEGAFISAGAALLQGAYSRAAAVDAQRTGDWMAHWQQRALRAEAQLAQARRALEKQADEMLELEALLEDA